MNALLALLLAVTPDVPKDAPGTWADPARSVFLVPGSRTLLSGFSVVSFDGLPFDDTSSWFDGVKLEQPAHALFGPTTLHPAWLEGVRVSAAIDSVERGRSLGRSVELLPRQVKPGGAHGVARVDLLQVGLYGEGQLGLTGTTVQAAGRFFALPALVASFLKIRALLGDWQLRLAQPIGAGELRFLLLGAFDDAALTVSGIPIEARIQTHQADLRWTSDGAHRFELGASAHAKSVGLSLNGEHTQNALDGLEQAIGLRAVARPRLTEQVGLSLGADVSLRRLVLRRSITTTVPETNGEPSARVSTGTQQDFGPAVLAGAHAELSIDEDAWHWRLGLRADVWAPVGVSPFVTLDPRLSVRRDAGGAVAIEGALGLKHQPASWLVPIPVVDTAAWRFGTQEAFFGEGAITVRPAEGHALKLRGYGAALLHTLELAPFDADFLQEVSFVSEEVEKRKGTGWVAGGELSWRFFDNGWLWGQAAYSLSGSWRRLNTVRYGNDGLPVGEEQAVAAWQYQQLHAWTAAGGLRTRNGWSLGVALTLQSGPPMMGGLFAQEQTQGVDPITGNPKWVPKDRDQVGSASPWFRFDARVSKTWRPGKAEVELFLDVQTLSIWAQPTGQSYGVASASLEDQARGNVQLTTKPASSVLPGPLPVLGVEIRL